MTAKCSNSKSIPAFGLTAAWVRDMHPTIEPTDAERVKVLEKMLEEHHTYFATAHSALLAGKVDYAIEVLAGVLNPAVRS